MINTAQRYNKYLFYQIFFKNNFFTATQTGPRNPSYTNVYMNVQWPWMA